MRILEKTQPWIQDAKDAANILVFGNSLLILTGYDKLSASIRTVNLPVLITFFAHKTMKTSTGLYEKGRKISPLDLFGLVNVTFGLTLLSAHAAEKLKVVAAADVEQLLGFAARNRKTIKSVSGLLKTTTQLWILPGDSLGHSLGYSKHTLTLTAALLKRQGIEDLTVRKIGLLGKFSGLAAMIYRRLYKNPASSDTATS